jgi:hypothetical protein
VESGRKTSVARMNPPTPGRQPICLRALHANAELWLTPSDLAAITGWTIKNAATSALLCMRAGLAERRPHPDGDTRRHQYRFVAFARDGETGRQARHQRRDATIQKRRIDQQTHTARILTLLKADPAKAFSEREIVTALPGLTLTQAREALAILTVQTGQLLTSTPRFKESQVTRYRIATLGLTPVRATPLTKDARALLKVLQHGTARNTSVTRAELLARVAGKEERLNRALALLEAHGLLELRPVGNLVLFRAVKAA